MQMEVEFQADLSTVQQKIPALYGTLTPTPTGVLLQEQYDDVESMARYLMALDLPFVIHNPPELREALRRLGERLVQIASVAPAVVQKNEILDRDHGDHKGYPF